jgi:hypothetical protein
MRTTDLLFLVSLILLATLGRLYNLASAEELTTGNLVPGVSEFTTSGSTSFGTGSGCSSGAFCTSGTSGGGGTYTSSFDVPLTEAEVQLGFTLNSGITINSHPSNSVLSSCANIMQSSDCRDIFRLSITLSDDGTAVESFSHQEELDFAGLRDFTFSDVVAANDYGVLTGIFELFGIDAGYPSGFYGPQFSNPGLTIDYQTALVQEEIATGITDQIEAETQDIIQEVIAPEAVPATLAALVESFPDLSTQVISETQGPSLDALPTVTVPDIPTTAAPVSSAPAELASSPEAPTAPVIAPIAPSSEAQQEQATSAEAEIEAEATSESAEEPKAASKPTKSASRRKVASTASSAAPVVSAPVTLAVAAQAVVDAIAPSQKYGSAAQTLTLVAMGIIAQTRGLLKGAGIPDAPVGFFTSATVPDGPSMVDRMQNYRIFGQANGVHQRLVESQWGK